METAALEAARWFAPAPSGGRAAKRRDHSRQEPEREADPPLNRRRKAMRAYAGIAEWPSNALRHSFKSFDEALNGGHDKTQHEMGHSNPSMTRYGYGTDTAGGFFVTKELAEQWFGL